MKPKTNQNPEDSGEYQGLEANGRDQLVAADGLLELELERQQVRCLNSRRGLEHANAMISG